MTIFLGIQLTALFNFDGSLDQGKALAKAVALLHVVVRILVFSWFFSYFFARIFMEEADSAIRIAS